MPELVVLADQLFAPVPGGTGRYTAELLRSLAETAPPEWSVTSVVSKRSDVSEGVVPGVNGPRVLPWSRRALAAMWQAGIAYWPGGDAIHAPTPLAPPGKPRAGKHRNGTLAVTVHDTVPWTHPNTLTKRGVRWHKSMIRRAVRRADVIVVPTRSVADELAERAPAGTRVEVIAHGVTDVFTAAEGAELPVDVSHLELPDRYILSIGTLEPRKGLEALIDAVARLHEATSRAPKLLLAGQRGWGEVDPAALARRYGAPAGAVRVLGRLPDRELAAVLRRSAALAAPSHAEGFGLPLLEAMSAGVPVVHSDAPAFLEVAGKAGVAVPRGDVQTLSDALRDVVEDGMWSAQLAAAGRRRAAEFSWRSAAERVWKLHLDSYRDGRQDVGPVS